MATLEPIAEPNKKADEPWKMPQRPGKLGVDYDDYGAEMAPNARVWKKYVEETDKMDKELVEGWNNSLDIILIFAALFSAISTAFVIESSKDLKPDYSQTSAQTLQLMSQTLSAIARGSLLNDSDAMVTETQNFTPSSSAIAVNTLWFLSLGLSVAVSLIAILAKEWCHSFMAGRVGSVLRQARLRQQRWDGIEQWKMKEILYVLPLLMHTALLLFAVGLSLYLWDIDMRVALPVVIITSLAALFYIVTVSLLLFFRFCPYTTALARFLYPYWLALLGNRHTMDSIGALIASVRWISYAWMWMKQTVNRRPWPVFQDRFINDDIETTGESQPCAPPFLFQDKMQEAHAPIKQWVDSMQAMFSTQRSQLVEKDTPMDDVASSMIAWMILNCEDSKSFDVALQALAGAGQTLPRLSLWECGTVDLLCQRINDCCNTFTIRSSDGPTLAQNTILDDASLYSRSFCFLTAFIAGEGLDMTDESEPRFVVKDNHERVARLQDTAYNAQSYLHGRLNEVLDYAWWLPTRRYDIVAYELNVVPVQMGMPLWSEMEIYRNQHQKQQELVQYITSGKVTDLPPGHLVALINGITKTYFYNTLQSPKLLIDLLHLLELPDSPYHGCKSALAIGITVAAFVAGDYFRQENKEEKLQADESRLKQARDAYTQLTEAPDDVQPSTLLYFGLLSLLNHKTEDKWTFDAAEIKLIGNQLADCWTARYYHNIVPGIPASFDGGRHVVQVLSKLISSLSSDTEPEGNTEALSPVLLRIEAALSLFTCWANGDRIVPLLTQHFTSTDSMKLKILCLRGIQYSLDSITDRVDVMLDSLVHTGLLTQVLEATTATQDDPNLTPYCMKFLWAAARVLICGSDEGRPETSRSVPRSLLQSLDNQFKMSPTEGGLPNNRDQLGLANLWLSKIDEICHRNPQSILDSNLLSDMIEFYEYEEHRDLKPRTAGLPGALETTWTWLQILQYWERGCKEAVEEKAKTGLLPDEKVEVIPAVCRVGRHEGESELCSDIHDWSI